MTVDIKKSYKNVSFDKTFNKISFLLFLFLFFNFVLIN